MTATIAHTLTCDCRKKPHRHPDGTPAPCATATTQPAATVTGARLKAAAFGWWSPGLGTGIDICPPCRTMRCQP